MRKIKKNGSLRRIVLGNHIDAITESNISIEKWFKNIMKQKVDKRYGVVTFKGNKWCRIMIIVANGAQK